jgi:hypothetical protein
MSKSGPLLAVVLLLPVVAAAQGAKISGTVVCNPPSPLHALPVEGRPDNAYAVSQVKCTWTKPWQIGGVASKDGVGTGTDAISGNASQSSGTYVDTMANGDKAFYKYEFNAITKDGKPEKISNHKWELIGGTGKMNAVKGKGTCNATVQADGKVVYDCQGEYK